jgi:hypothetical protein
MGAVITGAGRGGQGVQHRLHELGAFRGQVPVDDTRPAEGGGHVDGPVIERRTRVLAVPAVAVVIGLVLPRLLVHFRRQPGQVRHLQPGRGGTEQDLIRRRPGVVRHAACPPADLPRVRPGDRLTGQRRLHRRVIRRPPEPGRMVHRGAAGHLGPVLQPRPGTVIPVVRMVLPGAECAQHRGPHRRGDRVGLLGRLGSSSGNPTFSITAR